MIGVRHLAAVCDWREPHRVTWPAWMTDRRPAFAGLLPQRGRGRRLVALHTPTRCDELGGGPRLSGQEEIAVDDGFGDVDQSAVRAACVFAEERESVFFVE